MNIDFADFLRQFDEESYGDFAKDITQNYKETPGIPASDMANYTNYVAQATAIHYLREYHDWLMKELEK